MNAAKICLMALACWPFFAGAAPTASDLYDRAQALTLPAAPADSSGADLPARHNTAVKRAGAFALDADVPAGEVWRAVLEVDNTTELFINGQVVPDPSVMLPRPVRHTWMPANFYGTRPVNIAPYLHAGRNRIGLRGERDYVWLRGSIVMVSGKRVVLDSGTNWHWISRPGADWAAPDLPLQDLPLAAAAARARNQAQPDQPLAAPLTTLALRGPRGFKQVWAGRQPAADGLMELRNPDDLLLFFNAERDARLEVDIPAGVGARQPRLEWLLERYQDGAVQPAGNGECRDGVPAGHSLKYAVPLGRLPRGVYLFSASLFLDGELVDTLPPEPLAVIGGKLAMAPAAGTHIEDDLALELEDVVDFTRPDEARHPWMEIDATGRNPRKSAWTEEYVNLTTNALVVERGGLVYRETRPGYCAQFSYNVFFNHPGDWYLLTLEYPDDAERWIGVSCASAIHQRPRKAQTSDGISKCGPSVWTGGKYPNSGAMRKMHWLYRPDPGGHAVTVINLGKQTAPAAAARLLIQHVQGRLPELQVNPPAGDSVRRLGLLTERTAPGRGLDATFGVRREKGGPPRAAPDAIPAHAACACLLEYLETCEAYAEYLRFTGQNLHVMGAYQYHDANTGFVPARGRARLTEDLRDVLARVLEANDIKFYASVEFAYTTGLMEQAERARAATGSNPFVMVTQDGAPASAARGTAAKAGWNFAHPAVEKEMLRVADELALKFAGNRAFLGINWTAYFGGGWIPSWRAGDDPWNCSYDDATIAAFEQDTGIKLPAGAADSPERFRRRHEFLTAPDMRAQWMEWRCRKLADFFIKADAAIKGRRADLECVAGCYLSWHLPQWLQSGRPAGEYLMEWGWDPKLFCGQGVRVAPWLPAAALNRPSTHAEGYAWCWQGNAEQELYDAFHAGPRRSLMLHYPWWEVEGVAGQMPWREEWPRPYQSTMQANPAADFCRESFAQAMIGLDPDLCMFGFTDFGILTGYEADWRPFARVFRSLPPDEFIPWGGTGFQSNLAIRALRKDGRLYFYAVNPGYWPITGRIVLRGASAVRDLAAGLPVAVESAGDDVNLPLQLPPFGIAAFSADGAQAEIAGWAADRLDDTQTAHMRKIIARAQDMADLPGCAAALGETSYAGLLETIAIAQAALNAGEYARAWAWLTRGDFWTTVHQKREYVMHAELLGKKTMEVPRVPQPPSIDGRLDDAPWRQPAPAGGFVTADRQPAAPAWGTQVYACHDGRDLYLAFKCLDPQPGSATRGAAGERAVIGKGVDFVNFFIRPDLNGHEYFQFAANAGGGQFDQRCFGGAVEDDYAPDWTVKAGMDADGWVVEMRIPAAALKMTLTPGKVIGINFHRQVRGSLAPTASWSYQPGNWHDLDKLGTAQVN